MKHETINFNVHYIDSPIKLATSFDKKTNKLKDTAAEFAASEHFSKLFRNIKSRIS